MVTQMASYALLIWRWLVCKPWLVDYKRPKHAWEIGETEAKIRQVRAQGHECLPLSWY
jgi:hypothetical protein